MSVAEPQMSRPTLVVDEQGQAWAAWLDGRPVDRTSSDPLDNVALAVSRDDGTSFAPSWTVKGNACNCCRPSIANQPGHKDTFAMVWRDVVQQPGTENHGMEMDGMDPDGSSAPGKVDPRTDVRNVKVATGCRPQDPDRDGDPGRTDWWPGDES